MLTHENHPHPFTDENGYDIIRLIAAGASSQEAADTVGRSRSGFYEWMERAAKTGVTDVADAYKRARVSWSRVTADEVLDIADDNSGDFDARGGGNIASVRRSELRIKTRQWLLERFNRPEFGASRDVTTGGEKIGGAPVFVLHDPAAKKAMEQVIDAVSKN